MKFFLLIVTIWFIMTKCNDIILSLHKKKSVQMYQQRDHNTMMFLAGI